MCPIIEKIKKFMCGVDLQFHGSFFDFFYTLIDEYNLMICNALFWDP